MTPSFVDQIVLEGTKNLQLFNQNTLNFCHNMLRHLPRSKSAFINVSQDVEHDRVSEIESFLLDQTEKLIEVSKSSAINPDFGISMPKLLFRSDAEKRFTALLNHFIGYSKIHNPKVYDSLYVAYSDGSIGDWDKHKMDEFGGKLKGTNPIKLYNFAKAVANAGDPFNELEFEAPILKEPSKDLKVEDEPEKIAMTLLKDKSFEIDPNMDEDDFLELLAHLHVYAEALKYKENSIKLRQETLMSTYQANPNGTLRDMIVATNGMSMELKQEQMILSDVVNSLMDFNHAQGYAGGESILNGIEDTISTFTLMKDDKLNFIIRSEKLDEIAQIEPDPSFGLKSGYHT